MTQTQRRSFVHVFFVYQQVILGGGRRHFIPRDQTDIQYLNRTGRRSDDKNLIEDWVADKFKRNFAYNYVWRNEEFNEIDTEETDYLLGKVM